jgi:hypothetical protein
VLHSAFFFFKLRWGVSLTFAFFFFFKVEIGVSLFAWAGLNP